ncbi:hypothetical protein E6W39_30160 [Kitasatospora acidiphila]|uniref:Uncharacterized protein n=1 Tax=Kitasatospora acidiphila TaxID=2567942 RepID=A0A540W9M1_9ACTN|nr:hypothetical protein [Kitasatospora acidiphila]TQF05715.1 hypothetical protein E6W39_30160 [Kitasatospora acidiphila]
MQKKWTSVLVTGALAGSLAVTTGIAISHAAADNHPMISPAVGTPTAPKTLAAIGDLGAVLHLVGDLAATSSPVNGAAVNPTALKDQLAKLTAAADKLKAELPAETATTADDQSGVPGAPVDPAGFASPAGAAQPGSVNPGGPEQPGTAEDPGGPVQFGGPIQRDTQPAAAKGVAELLTALRQHAGVLVSAASAKQPDAAKVQKAMVPLSTDALQLSTAAVNRLSAK